MRRLSLAIAVVSTIPLLGQSAVSYHVTHTYELGGDGGWDYIVPSHDEHRVYIGRTNRVMVVDENDGRLLGEVMGIKGAHGTAIARSHGSQCVQSSNGTFSAWPIKSARNPEQSMNRSPSIRCPD